MASRRLRTFEEDANKWLLVAGLLIAAGVLPTRWHKAVAFGSAVLTLLSLVE